MASLNNQQLITVHRQVKSLEYNADTRNWDIIFIGPEGKEIPGTMPVGQVGMNYYLALQLIIVNYCLNNEDEANLWQPTIPLSDIQVTDLSKPDEPPLYQYDIEYENGVSYGWKSSEKIDQIAIVENLIIHGITYYVDQTDYNDFVHRWVIIEHYDPTDGALISVFNNPLLKMEVIVHDNANMEITDDMVKRAYPYILKAAFMLYGMISTKIKVGNYNKGYFTNCNDLKIPGFSISLQPGMQPEAVVYDDLTYTLANENGDTIITVNE